MTNAFDQRNVSPGFCLLFYLLNFREVVKMSQLRLYDGFYNTELQRVRSLHLFHTLVSTVSISADPQVSEGLAEWEECSLYAVTA